MQTKSIAVSATTFSSRNSSAPFVGVGALRFGASASPRLPIVRIAMSSALRTLRTRSEGSHRAAPRIRPDSFYWTLAGRGLLGSTGADLLALEPWETVQSVRGNAVVQHPPVDDTPMESPVSAARDPYLPS